MKKISLGVLLLCCIVSIASAEELNVSDGFRNLKWGDPPSVLDPEIQLYVEDPETGTKFYTRKGDKLEFEGVPLSEISYWFKREGLFSVSLKLKEPENIQLKKILFQQLGYPGEEDASSGSCLWTTPKSLVMLNKEKLSLWSKEEFNKKRAPAKASNLKNAPTGFRDLKWGDPVSKLGKAVEFTGTELFQGFPVDFYLKREEKLKIGAIPLDKIGYGFLDNKFAIVVMKITHGAEFSLLKKTLFDRFGYPDREDALCDSYNWDGSNESIGLGRDGLLFLSRTIFLERLKILEEQMETASDDF
nr:hypothetical protein [uncultured Dethiosulfovibrio sp.]